MPIPEPPGGIKNVGKDEGGRGRSPSNQRGRMSPAGPGGVAGAGMDVGGRGGPPNSGSGFGPGDAGGAMSKPNRGSNAPMPSMERRSG